tara:strand:+ start:84 stop:305 length:222 start_codon:yes stop_codon:yes gene_type:complete
MGKKPNMRDVAGEDHKPEPRGNPGVVTDGAVKGDKSESGSNSYAKDNQLAIAKLKNGTTQPFSKYADSQKRGF